MSSSPSSSDNTTFEFAPSLTLFYSTNYKIRIKTAASDIAGNTMASDNTTANGFNTTDIVPITSGYAHNCFMLDNGSVKCWGANASGQLGLGHTNNRGDNSSFMGDNLLAVDLGTGKTVRAIEAGDNHTCAILDNESVKCWGANASGQLGLGHTNNRGDNSSLMGDNLLAVDLGSDRTAKAIAAGYAHTCAILDNSLVKCWGSNTSGQLGLGDTDSRGDNASEMGGSLTTVDLGTTAKAISAGDSHTCAILDNSQVKCWGDNYYGQLGQGDNINRGYGSNQMGSLNPVNLGSERTAKSITTGTGYTCVILDDDSVKCWGRGHAGQLAHGKTQPVDSPPNLPINLGSGITAKAITAGKFHTCAVIDNSSIKCWGLNDSGQLGLENTSNRGDEQNEMGDNLPAVDLGAGKTARAISTGDRHTCAILDNASIKCWGANASGQLGLGHTNNRGGNSSEMGDNLNVISL
jgi:alpha-tubulin suppressor-like RCC1 family protein